MGDLMKLRVLLMLALFPFLHATSYQVQLVSCAKEEIVVQYEDSNMNVTLFNLKITNEKGWQQVSQLLTNAKKIRIEIDPTSKIADPLPVYLFVDDKLVQEEIIKNGYGYPMIRNREYTYEKRLEEAFDTTQTVAKVNVSNKQQGKPFVAPLYWTSFMVLWLGLLLIILRTKKKK